MTEASSPALPAQRRLPSRLMASLYLVLGIAALILASRPETGALRRYAIGVATEVGLALIVLVFMRLERLSIVETARLRLPTLESVLLAVLAAPGMWITGVILNLAAVAILGYTAPASPAQYPRNGVEALALAVTTMVVAPLCEELMFRGYVQRAFERRSAWRGVVFGGLIFSIYHLRFQGVFALIPVALALGYIAWRTQSIFPGMALHATFNTIATLLLVAMDFLPLQLTGALTGALICLGVIITPISFVALWLLWKRTAPPQFPPLPKPRGFRRWAWVVPIAGLLLVYAYAAATEVILGRFPEVVFRRPLQLEAPLPAQFERWHYTAQDVLGQALGEATCTRVGQNGSITLSCQASHEGFDLTDEIPALQDVPLTDLPFGLPSLGKMLHVAPESWTIDATWASRDLTLSAFEGSAGSVDRPYQLSYQRQEQVVRIEKPSGQTETLTGLPEGEVYMPYEWAWRLQALPFDVAYGGTIALVEVDENAVGHVYPALVVVEGGEPTWTTDRSYVTWKVTTSWTDDTADEHTLTAWYDSVAPHTLVRLDDGSVTYALDAIEAAGRPGISGAGRGR